MRFCAEFYGGMNEKWILKVANRNSKYCQLDSKLTNKAIPRPIKGKRVMEQLQLEHGVTSCGM